MIAVPKPYPHRWHDHRVVTFAGMFDTHTATGECYQTRALADLFDVRPACVPKQNGPAFIPSTYADPDARSHTAQRTHGSFVALTADIDHGDHAPGYLQVEMKVLVGPAATLIYSSPHCRPGDRRWRVIVPLAEPVSYALWHDAQTALCDHLALCGIDPDRALCRAAQPVFLPNVPHRHAKTGLLLSLEGQPFYFLWRSTGIDAPGLSLDHGPVAVLMARVARRRMKVTADREQRRIESLHRPVGNTGDPVAAFNRANGLSDLLTRYGYQPRAGAGADWRSPYQTGQTYATRVMGAKWFSLSASDAGVGLGAPHNAGCFGDAFDLFVHFDHGGNRRAAFRAIVQEARP